MASWPALLRRRDAVGHLLRRLIAPVKAGSSGNPGNRDELERWRGHLQASEEALRRLDLSLIGSPEGETDPELCLVKGALLVRAGHDFDAQPFFRQAPRLTANRRRAGAVALRAAAQDSGFQGIIKEADQARDAREWREAGDLYGDALRAYPHHYGYVVQYAHCLKEQGQFAEAECHYRSALALGAPRSDVDEHLTFVASHQGFPAAFDGYQDEGDADGDPLDAAPTKADVELVIFLLLGRDPKLSEICSLMRKHHSLRSLILAIVEEGSFASANPRLLSTGRQRDRAEQRPGSGGMERVSKLDGRRMIESPLGGLGASASPLDGDRRYRDRQRAVRPDAHLDKENDERMSGAKP